MVPCRYCSKDIHEQVPSCPQCGGVLISPASATANEGGSLWMAITSLVLGVLGILALTEDSKHGKEELIGMGIILSAGWALGVISLGNKKAGKGMAIAGVVLLSLSLLVLLGSF